MQWQDVFGLAGLALVILGTGLMFPSSTHSMRLSYLLGGSIVWLAGFATVTGWIAWRWWTAHPSGKERPLFPPTERRNTDRRSQSRVAV